MPSVFYQTNCPFAALVHSSDVIRFAGFEFLTFKFILLRIRQVST